MVKWCRENASLCGLSEAPIRTIVDDCLKFVARREIQAWPKKYDAIIMRPAYLPAVAPRAKCGKLEDNLWELLKECRDLLSDKPLFFLINAYTARLSPTVVANLLTELLHDCGGDITAGEVGLPIQRDQKILPCGIYGRWESDL